MRAKKYCIRSQIKFLEYNLIHNLNYNITVTIWIIKCVSETQMKKVQLGVNYGTNGNDAPNFLVILYLDMYKEVHRFIQGVTKGCVHISCGCWGDYYKNFGYIDACPLKPYFYATPLLLLLLKIITV